MKNEYKFKGPTITLKGWGNMRFDKERYAELFAGDDLRTLSWLCDTPEETATLNAFKEFKNTLTDRQFAKYLEENK